MIAASSMLGAGASTHWIEDMKPTAPTGYSGTPLARKLGYKDATRAALVDAPADYAALVAPLPPGVSFDPKVGPATKLVHVFATERTVLAKHLAALRKILPDEAALWVSWPKKASKLPTTITEDTIRELALPLGFVDIKVCAVSEVWSGLKLVIRKELRKESK
jgi:hypothetical protein